MRARELNQLFWIKKDIERSLDHIEQLKEEATRTTTLLSSMPKSKSFSDRLSRIIANIVDEQALVLYKTEQLTIERRKIEYTIDSIKDAKVRFYMRSRFVDCMSFQEIANKCGNTITADGVRKSIVRYLGDLK